MVLPLQWVPSAVQRAAHDEYLARVGRVGSAGHAKAQAQGRDENCVIGEYSPGQVVEDHDGKFAEKFLYAFWRLCEQRIADVREADINHSARVTAERAGVPAEVRVVDIRHAAGAGCRNLG